MFLLYISERAESNYALGCSLIIRLVESFRIYFLSFFLMCYEVIYILLTVFKNLAFAPTKKVERFDS